MSSDEGGSRTGPPVVKKKKKKVKKKETEVTLNIELAGSEYDHSKAPSVQQKVFVEDRLKQLDTIYERGHQLGCGAFAKVFLGKHRASNGVEYAIKKIDRAKMVWGDRDALEDEINNLIAVRHGPNIVELYEVYEEKSHCYLVMELMRGGELFDIILEKKIFNEKEARVVTRCLLNGLNYMHQQRIAHRDLKPENLLLVHPVLNTSDSKDLMHNDISSKIEVKIADFGFAKHVTVDNGCRTLCGTPGYLAPEILERFPAYDTKCDLWGVGVILFLLLGGYLPFEDEDEDKVFEKTRNGQYFFHPSYWKSITSKAKDIVTKFLMVNPKKRYAAKDALIDEWMDPKNDILCDQQQIPTDGEKEDLILAKNKQKAAIKAVRDGNRMEVLHDNVNGFLNRQPQEARLTTEKVGGTGGGHDVPTSNRRISVGESSRKSKKKETIEDSASGKPVKDFYEFGDLLGEGGYAKVYRCVHKRTKDIFAIKDIDTSVLENNAIDALKDEIAALKLLRGGPHIIRLIDVFEAKYNTYMVMEECKGGDLLDRVTDKEFYSEREARKTCSILFQAVDYIHKKKIAHRDIKPENVLLVHKDDDTSIKIADFGFAKRVTKPNCLRTLCGTAQYVAPEVLDLSSPGYDNRADMWSVGVVTYILLGGYAPFDGPVHELATVICRGEYEFHDKYWKDISDAAKNMIRNLLQVDPKIRYSAEQALTCPWMIIEEESLTVKDLSGAQATLKANKDTNKTEGAKANVIVRKVDKQASLDDAFMHGLGTAEEVRQRRKGGKRPGKKGGKGGDNELNDIDEDDVEEQKQLIDDSTCGKPFEQIFTWGRIIEKGDLSTLREAGHKQTNLRYTVKCIKRTDLIDTADAVAVQDEISTLQMLKECKQIITLHDVYEEADYTYMVFERLKGGELIDKIIENRCYSENDARLVARNILLGLEFCHNRRIANRNLKAENLLLCERGNLTAVKISDFSFAKRVLYPNSLRTQIGTEGYVAPEILEHRPAYDVQCDMWSLGVVLYILLGGYRPFRGEGEEVWRLTRYGIFKFHKRYWSAISEDAKILISRMLTVDPVCRITATAALQSEWIQATDEQFKNMSLNDPYHGDRDALRESAKYKIRAAVNSIRATNRLLEE